MGTYRPEYAEFPKSSRLATRRPWRRSAPVAPHHQRPFIRENHAQLSFSEGELMQKKTGLLATMFPVLGGFRMQNRRIPMRVTDVDRRRN